MLEGIRQNGMGDDETGVVLAFSKIIDSQIMFRIRQRGSKHKENEH
jgi:hypothetical protein